VIWWRNYITREETRHAPRQESLTIVGVEHITVGDKLPAVIIDYWYDADKNKPAERQYKVVVYEVTETECSLSGQVDDCKAGHHYEKTVLVQEGISAASPEFAITKLAG
jgi:hypothetical protein